MPAREAKVVAIDGPSGAGKGTLAQALAAELGWHYLDSGALYRALGWLAVCARVDLQDIDGLVKLVGKLNIDFVGDSVLCGGENIDVAIRNEAAGARASQVAKIPQVRLELLKWQRACARPPGLVADGRDMGTVVFPNAVCKIFLTADIESRAMRRFKQLRAQGLSVNIEILSDEIARRDQQDKTRKASPLQAATDAYVLDTTKLSIIESTAAVRTHLKKCAVI